MFVVNNLDPWPSLVRGPRSWWERSQRCRAVQKTSRGVKAEGSFEVEVLREVVKNGFFVENSRKWLRKDECEGESAIKSRGLGYILEYVTAL